MSISELCLYCASAHLLLSISAHCNNTCIIQHYHCYVYHKCCTQDSNMYNTSAPSVSVSHHIDNRWAGYSTTSACISYTRTVCAAPAKNTDTSIYTYASTIHGQRSTKIVQTQTKGRPHCTTSIVVQYTIGHYAMVCACADSL